MGSSPSFGSSSDEVLPFPPPPHEVVVLIVYLSMRRMVLLIVYTRAMVALGFMVQIVLLLIV